MGSCVSSHQKQSSAGAMKVDMFYGSNDVKQTHVISGDDVSAAKTSLPSFQDFGSKEETFFDSQAWLDSDCDDDFMSVNGEFTPSRGNTPVHHNFSAGNNKPPVSPYQPSPTGTEKKMRLSDLFNDSQRGNYNSESEDDGVPANKNGVNSKVASPLVNSGEVTANGVHGLKTKRERFGRTVQNCFPSLISSRSSSTNGRKMMSPGLSPRPSPVVA
ncbi:hypothetical protein CTI12_AA608770 [Artemisia annua]|uniref:Uncharacterized protein n=1 Tax=Artemisia annua TaxID=35608 RepID=A0A2U1KFC9_ARTAN|nr:hypothetical protein CTI12_AA608770 [Artemisia annua]